MYRTYVMSVTKPVNKPIKKLAKAPPVNTEGALGSWLRICSAPQVGQNLTESDGSSLPQFVHLDIFLPLVIFIVLLRIIIILPILGSVNPFWVDE